MDFVKLRRAVKNPRAVIRKLNSFFHTRFNSRPWNPKGVNIFDEDWDNLIILDACRYDAFEAVAAGQFSGMLESRISRGSATPEWVRGNFGPGLNDTVYVTGSSWVTRLQDELDINLHKIEAIVRRDQRDKYKQVAEKALTASDEYPNKRLLVHFTVPHHPFVGPTADQHLPSFEEQQSYHFFDDLAQNRIKISDDLLRKAHEENLERILPTVRQLIEKFEGKTVISSDHGELLGERVHPIPTKVYGHPPGLYHDILNLVPWFICEFETRRQIVAEEPEEEERPSSDAVEQQLRDLGYKV